MKNLSILFICIMLLLNTIHVFAYQLEAEDMSAYAFLNGSYEGSESKSKCVYEVDEKQGIITETSTKLEGIKTDLATLDPVSWKIVDKIDGKLTAVRTHKTGEDFISFHSDGTYYFFQTLYYYNTKRDGFDKYTSVWFGRYTVNSGDINE